MANSPKRVSKETQKLTLRSKFSHMRERTVDNVLHEFGSIETLENTPRSAVLDIDQVGPTFTAKLGIWDDDGKPAHSLLEGTCPVCGEHHVDYVYAEDRFSATIDLSDVDSVCVDVEHPNTRGKYAPRHSSRTSVYIHDNTIPDETYDFTPVENDDEDDELEAFSPEARRSEKMKRQRRKLRIGNDGIGESKAKKIFNEFGSLEAIENATLDEVTSIDGIGEGTASKIGIWDENGDPVKEIPRNPCSVCGENVAAKMSNDFGLEASFDMTGFATLCLSGANPPTTGIADETVPTVTTMWGHE